MRAKDLAASFPTVRFDTPAYEAARVLADQDLLGLIVVDDDGRPVTVLPGTQLLLVAVPRYVQDDPALGRVVGEQADELFLRELHGRTVADCLPEAARELPVVDPDATVLEIAALMARAHSPVVAVVDGGTGLLGAVTLDALLDRALAG